MFVTMLVINVHMYVPMYMLRYLCVYMAIYIYIYLFICVCVCVCVCVDVFTHLHVYFRELQTNFELYNNIIEPPLRFAVRVCVVFP